MVVRLGRLSLSLRTLPSNQYLAPCLFFESFLVGPFGSNDKTGVVEGGVPRDKDLSHDFVGFAEHSECVCGRHARGSLHSVVHVFAGVGVETLDVACGSSEIFVDVRI